MPPIFPPGFTSIHVTRTTDRAGSPGSVRRHRFLPVSGYVEVGCGDGTFWKENLDTLPDNLVVVLSDISNGMLRDARRTLELTPPAFLSGPLTVRQFPMGTKFDLVIANHVLFYCDDISAACAEIARVLKPGGTFLCSTYGQEHMKEISQLVSSFDDRIVLSSTKLYDRFGKENGRDILSPYFPGSPGNNTRTF